MQDKEYRFHSTLADLYNIDIFRLDITVTSIQVAFLSKREA